MSKHVKTQNSRVLPKRSYSENTTSAHQNSRQSHLYFLCPCDPLPSLAISLGYPPHEKCWAKKLCWSLNKCTHAHPHTHMHICIYLHHVYRIIELIAANVGNNMIHTITISQYIIHSACAFLSLRGLVRWMCCLRL